MSSVARDLGDAITAYQQQRVVYDAARATCEYDWAYYGHDHEEQLERASWDLEKAMDAFLLDHADRHRLDSEDD